ncbi:MAG TPA: glyoxalase superfamily protein [Actinomycetota bacterium]|jgi:catechol 2,3-dioxygenase-like lactoylglutathione lyase family enzyme
MNLRHVRLVSVPVSDQDRSKAFYTETLGLELIAEEDMASGNRWVEVGPAGGETSISLVTWLESMVPGSLRGLILLTGDIQADYQELSRRGVQFLGPIEEQHWGKFVQFKDPDGNVLVLQENL